MNGKVLITGPTSGIGRAVAHRLAAAGHNLILAGRDREETERIVTDLRVRYDATISSKHYEALAFESHREFLDSCCAGGELNGLVMCHGYMVEQTLTENDFRAAATTIDVNYKSYVSLLNDAARYFKQRRNGFICVVSSVAGDRGRQSNYTYGSAKAALTTYTQGLRNRLAPYGVSVITVKPGFVDTGMTWGLLKPQSLLVASPERVAVDIVRAIERRKDVIYTPWFWRWVMMVIRLIPEGVFKKLKL